MKGVTIFTGIHNLATSLKRCRQNSSFFGEYCQVCFQKTVHMFLFHAKIYIACIISDLKSSSVHICPPSRVP